MATTTTLTRCFGEDVDSIVGSSSTVGSDAYMDSVPDSVVDSSPADGDGRLSNPRLQNGLCNSGRLQLIGSRTGGAYGRLSHHDLSAETIPASSRLVAFASRQTFATPKPSPSKGRKAGARWLGVIDSKFAPPPYGDTGGIVDLDPDRASTGSIGAMDLP